MNDEQIIKKLKGIDEKLRILILIDLGYIGHKREQIKYFIKLGINNKEIADILKVKKNYIAKERNIIKKEIKEEKENY